jgi:hypothetical protein
MGTTADKIAKAILAQGRSGVIDLSSYRAGKAAIEDARLGDGRLRELLTKGYDTAHAAFIYAQNCASFLSEQMSASAFSTMSAKCRSSFMEDDYQPSFPPASPVTKSYFTMWALFDVLFGQSHETIGTCILRVSRDMPFPGWLEDAIRRCRSHAWAFTYRTVLRIASSAYAKSTAKA